ncbi:MAG: hypothetical protein OEV78_06875 [Spirochaetia bacterium]|nr:hypothetical protein [Spirochaetia bacterium]
MKIKNVKNCIAILALMLMGAVAAVDASEPEKKYSIAKITFIGNVRVPEKKIREMLSIKEGMKLSLRELEFSIKVSKAKMEGSGLFMFIEMNYETRDDATCNIIISMGENVMMLDIIGLEEGAFTRFSSISEKSPDFGFMVGLKSQSLYFRFPYWLGSPLDLATTVTHHSYKIPFYTLKEYDYEAASGRAALSMSVLRNWKIKVPAMFRYNIKSDTKTVNTSDLSTGLETLLDFSHYKDVIYAGFDLNAAVYQGIVKFPYTMTSAGVNVYVKPAKWEEIILRGRYRSTVNGNIPDYLLYRIDNEYQIHGQITNHYFGRNSVVLNAENWIRDIVTVPSSITNIHFNLLAYVDLAMAGDQIVAIHRDTWNLSTGGAISVEFSAPLNLALQVGYGHELWQNTGGQFYVKMGYEYRKGNFFE